MDRKSAKRLSDRIDRMRDSAPVVLSDRIREIEKAHRQVTGVHQGCAHCVLLNKIEIVLDDFGRFLEKLKG